MRSPIIPASVNTVCTPLFTFRIFFLFGSIVFVIRRLFLSMKRFDGVEKWQAKSIFFGVLGFGSFSFLFSFLWPALGFSDFIFLDTISTLWFVGFVACAFSVSTG